MNDKNLGIASRLANQAGQAKESQPAWLAVVCQKVETLRFGVVQIIVHDSKVVQIERTEKTRLDQPCSC